MMCKAVAMSSNGGKLIVAGTDGNSCLDGPYWKRTVEEFHEWLIQGIPFHEQLVVIYAGNTERLEGMMFDSRYCLRTYFETQVCNGMYVACSYTNNFQGLLLPVEAAKAFIRAPMAVPRGPLLPTQLLRWEPWC